MPSIRFNLKDASSKEDTLIFLIFRYNGVRFKYSTGEKVKPKEGKENKMKERASNMGSADKNPRLQKIKSKQNKIKTKFNFKEASFKEDTLIFLIFRYNGVRFKYSTGEKVKPKEWNANKMEVRASYMGSADKNARLQKIKSELNKIYTKYYTEGKFPTNKILSDELDKALQKDILSEVSFFKALDEFIETSPNSKGTIKKYISLRNHLLCYSKKKNTVIDFHTIDLEFYERFVKFFLDQGKLNNTIGKYISTLKAFLNWATEKGY